MVTAAGLSIVFPSEDAGAIEPGAIEPGAIDPGASEPGAIDPGGSESAALLASVVAT
jgi:hypothetical protein